MKYLYNINWYLDAENMYFSLCYIKYYMDFRFVPSDSVGFGKLSHLISKQEDEISSGHSGRIGV